MWFPDLLPDPDLYCGVSFLSTLLPPPLSPPMLRPCNMESLRFITKDWPEGSNEGLRGKLESCVVDPLAGILSACVQVRLCVRGRMLARPARFRQGHATLRLELQKQRRKEPTSVNQEGEGKGKPEAQSHPAHQQGVIHYPFTPLKCLVVHRYTFQFTTSLLSCVACLPPRTVSW